MSDFHNWFGIMQAEALATCYGRAFATPRLACSVIVSRKSGASCVVKRKNTTWSLTASRSRLSRSPRSSLPPIPTTLTGGRPVNDGVVCYFRKPSDEQCLKRCLCKALQ